MTRSGAASSQCSSPRLQSLIVTAQKNMKKHKNGYRYEENLKLFASYIFILGGRDLYRTLHKNLSLSLPSPSTVSRNIQQINQPIREGVFRFHELKTYLSDRDLPLCVWISEDGTRITGRIQYDSRFNQVVGFVSPCEINESHLLFFYHLENT